MVKLESDGTFIVHSGGADIGTGLDTVVAKLSAEVLGCPLSDVHVISGDTDHALFDKGGLRLVRYLLLRQRGQDGGREPQREDPVPRRRHAG